MIEWLAENVSVFKMQHNAHHEFKLSVEQHLLHRKRIGEALFFLNSKDRETCVARDELWELRIILSDGAVMDIAGSSLDTCVGAARTAVEGERIPHLAA
ncbi:MAG TPA: hypothetical protein VF475_16910 [Sphingobium sp.]